MAVSYNLSSILLALTVYKQIDNIKGQVHYFM